MAKSKTCEHEDLHGINICAEKQGEAGGHLMDLRARESQTVNRRSLESMAG